MILFIQVYYWLVFYYMVPMKGELTTMMRASEEKHFSKPTRLTDFKIYLFIYLFIYFGGGDLVEYLGKYIFF